MSLEEYQVAQMYMVRKMQQQNKSFEDDVLWSLLFQNLPSTKELGRPTLVKSMEDFDQGLLPESKDIYSGQRAQL
ncbi:hypothetical protein Pyn_26861 [Prunus yedoensis var. nudiflora]|uniref:Uncharacterized protein n=1 Tax=Prunus yedoensis var. nudiflora TaxID=2094558 RepID=A0A314ZIP0_PRUYE|nr:hypothetical protein Pyn_26861 [Prunus yedoensis var. nudiflora]